MAQTDVSEKDIRRIENEALEALQLKIGQQILTCLPGPLTRHLHIEYTISKYPRPSGGFLEQSDGKFIVDVK